MGSFMLSRIGRPNLGACRPEAYPFQLVGKKRLNLE